MVLLDRVEGNVGFYRVCGRDCEVDLDVNNGERFWLERGAKGFYRRGVLWNPAYLEREMKNIAREIKACYFLLGKSGYEDGKVFQEYTLFKKVGRIRVIDKTARGKKKKIRSNDSD
jgi:hypothetical protein